MTVTRTDIRARDLLEGDVVIGAKGERLTVVELVKVLEQPKPDEREQAESAGAERFHKGWFMTGFEIEVVNTVTGKRFVRERKLNDLVTVEREERPDVPATGARAI